MGTKCLRFIGIFLLIEIVRCRYTISDVNAHFTQVQSVSGLSLDPNDVDKQKFLLRGMDPEAVKEVLITKQPVIQTSIDNEGRKVKITYKLTPSGVLTREKTIDTSSSLNAAPNAFSLRSNWPSTQTSVFRSRTSFDEFDDFSNGFDSFTTTTSTTTPKPDVKPITIINLDELPGTSLTKDADGVTHTTYNRRPTFSDDSLPTRNAFKFNWDSFPETRRTYNTISTSNVNSDVPYEIIPTRNFGYNFGSYPETPLSKIPDSITPVRTYSSSPSFNINSRGSFDLPSLTKNLVTEVTKKYMVFRHNDGIDLEANCTLNKINSLPQSNTRFGDSMTANNGFSLPHSSEWNPTMIDQTFTKTVKDSDGNESTETCTITNVQLKRLKHFPKADTLDDTIRNCVTPKTTDIETDNTIDGFLKRINISEEDIKADGGEYIKNIIEDNGRILSIKLILSHVQGDTTQSANLNESLDKKPIK